MGCRWSVWSEFYFAVLCSSSAHGHEWYELVCFKDDSMQHVRQRLRLLAVRVELLDVRRCYLFQTMYSKLPLLNSAGGRCNCFVAWPDVMSVQSQRGDISSKREMICQAGSEVQLWQWLLALSSALSTNHTTSGGIGEQQHQHDTSAHTHRPRSQSNPTPAHHQTLQAATVSAVTGAVGDQERLPPLLVTLLPILSVGWREALAIRTFHQHQQIQQPLEQKSLRVQKSLGLSSLALDELLNCDQQLRSELAALVQEPSLASRYIADFVALYL